MIERCPRCDGEELVVSVPDSLASYADGAAVACCRRCLSTRSVPAERAESDPDFERLVGGFPDGEAGAATVLLLGKLPSLALNRSTIEALVARAEDAGADVFLTLDRLSDAEGIEPAIDLDRRRMQLEQLLG